MLMDPFGTQKGMEPTQTDWLTPIFAMLGIAVTVVLFLFGQRQTVGAHKQRVRSANDEIERILVRHIVREGFNPDLEDITRLIDAKARDFQVRATALLSEVQFMSNVFTRIIKSDLIPKEQREEVLRRLTPAIEQIEITPMQERSLESTSFVRSALVALSTCTMAVGALGAGVVVVLLPDVTQTGGEMQGLTDILPIAGATAAASLLAIILILVLTWSRERFREEPSPISDIAQHATFEARIIRTLRRTGISA